MAKNWSIILVPLCVLPACVPNGTDNAPAACQLDGECNADQFCDTDGMCTGTEGRACAWAGSRTWASKAVWHVSGELLQSSAMATGPDNKAAWCLHTLIRDGEERLKDRVRLGIGRVGHFEVIDLYDPPASSQASCMDVGFYESGAVVWLVSVDGQVRLVTSASNTALDASSLSQTTVATHAEIRALGSFDRQTRGALGLGAHEAEQVLVSIARGFNLLYRGGENGWRPVWKDWEPSQYPTGAPSFLLRGVSDLEGRDAFVTYNPHPGKPAAVRWQTDEPKALWDGPPFALDAPPGAVRAIHAWVSKEGHAELLWARDPSSEEKKRALYLARRLGRGAWESERVLDDYHAVVGRLRAAQASAVFLPAGGTALFIQNTQESQGPWYASRLPESAAMRVAWKVGAVWHSTEVKRAESNAMRHLCPAGLAVGCGHPAVYFWEQDLRVAGNETITLVYAEGSTDSSRKENQNARP